jgi:hypothetical protein
MNIIMTLDTHQIAAIRKDFSRYPNSEASLPEFVEVMLVHLRLGDVRATAQELVFSLIDLFRSMDLDGSESVSFEEFLSTVVQMGMSGTDQLLLDPVLHYLEGPAVKCEKRFPDHILRYSPACDKLLVAEVGHSGCTFRDPSTLRAKHTVDLQITSVMRGAEKSTNGAVILALEYFEMVLLEEAENSNPSKVLLYFVSLQLKYVVFRLVFRDCRF